MEQTYSWSSFPTSSWRFPFFARIGKATWLLVTASGAGQPGHAEGLIAETIQWGIQGEMTPVVIDEDAGIRNHPAVDTRDLLKFDALVQIHLVCRLCIKANIAIQKDDERASVPPRSTVGRHRPQQGSASMPVRSMANGPKLNGPSGMACCVYYK